MRRIQLVCGLAVMTLWAFCAFGQLSSDDIAALRAQGEREGWTFTVSENGATSRPLDSLCGFKPTEAYAKSYLSMKAAPEPNPKDLPAAFDWRPLGVTSIKDQANCGSCWAFSMVGALECAIKIHDGVEVDLSEQWLVSCNREGWGCDGSIFLFDYFLTAPDKCGQSGAVLESDFPYLAYDADCNCPHEHHYWINSWGSAGSTVASIKQAIMNHGPVSVSIITNGAFQAYTGGVLNVSAPGTIFDVNHAVVLVGWDDSLGTAGAWILRNSWSPSWGMSGYAYIEYGCSQVGAFATYVDYGDDLDVSPNDDLYASGGIGGPFSPTLQQYTLVNNGAAPVAWSAAAFENWITLSPQSGSLAPGAHATVTAVINDLAGSLPVGASLASIAFTNTGHGVTRYRAITVNVEPSIIYRFPLDTDPGWTTQGGWAFGQPTGQGSHNLDPVAGYTGNNVYGYNLNGDYENSMAEASLTTAALDCSNFSEVKLQFRRWLGVESSSYDHAKVQVSNDGITWTTTATVWENPSHSMAETSWALCEYNIATFADHRPTVYVRWVMGPTDSIHTYPGWNIDDVVITGWRDGFSQFEFTEVPHAATLIEGDQLALQVRVTDAVGGVSGVSYQWIKNGTALAGETFDSFTVYPVGVNDAGSYCCRVRDQSKGVRTTTPVEIRVYPKSALPAATIPVLTLGALSLLVGACGLLRKRLHSERSARRR